MNEGALGSKIESGRDGGGGGGKCNLTPSFRLKSVAVAQKRSSSARRVWVNYRGEPTELMKMRRKPKASLSLIALPRLHCHQPSLQQLQISNDLNRTNICCTLVEIVALFSLFHSLSAVQFPLLGSSGAQLTLSTVATIMMAFGCKSQLASLTAPTSRCRTE